MPVDAEILRFTPQQQPPQPAAIVLQNITVRRHGVPLLDHASFALSATGVTGLLGPNGAGKSILLRVLAGLVKPDDGHLTLASDLHHPALVFQKPVLLRRSVKANLLHALRIANVPRRLRMGRLAEMLVTAGLTNQAETAARALSGGEQQRLAMVRAMATAPQLLLLDEPTASLDPAATAAIEAQVRAIAQSGVKVIFVTHDRSQAARICDDIVFLHQGKVTEHSPATQFFQAPQSQIASRYLTGDLLL